jgi:hypothetical protein
MTTSNPEHPIDRLERSFADLMHRSAGHFADSDSRIKTCADRMRSLQSRVNDIDKIEAMLFEAYAETHAEAERNLLAITMATDWDFINLPSISAMRNRS